jgi:hypothetical protein
MRRFGINTSELVLYMTNVVNLGSTGFSPERFGAERQPRDLSSSGLSVSVKGADQTNQDGGTASEGVEVRVIRDAKEIEDIRGAWKLWHHHPNSDIDFYLNILRSLPEIRSPYILVLSRDGKPESILVGRSEHGRIGFKWGYRNVYSPTLRKLTFIYGGGLGTLRVENCKALIDHLVKSLHDGEGDLAEVRYVRTDSPIYSSAKQASGIFSRDHFPAIQMHRGTQLPDNMENFYRQLSSKARKNLKWQSKKMLQDFGGNVRVECFNRPSELDRLFQDVEEIAKKTYQRGLGVGFVDDAEMRDRFQFEAEKGWLRAYVLYIADKPCAFWVGSLYGFTFHSNFMGYDAAFAKYSPGMYLVIKTIENFIGRKDADRPTQIDWGLGDAQYKEVLGDSAWEEASLYIFAPTFRGFGLNVLHTLAALTDEVLKRMLERTKLLQRVKKIWRNRIRQKQQL